jgi:hypothetical protein
MSTTTRPLPEPASGTDAQSALGVARDAASDSLEAGAFWAAIALPFVHTPLLATGIDTTGTLGAYVALLLCNVVALVAGHGYAGRDD